MSADKLSARELAKRLEDHAATHEIIFGKQFRSEEERQAAAELRRQDESEVALLEALIHLHHNAKASKANMGLALDVAEAAIKATKEARNG